MGPATSDYNMQLIPLTVIQFSSGHCIAKFRQLAFLPFQKILFHHMVGKIDLRIWNSLLIVFFFFASSFDSQSRSSQKIRNAIVPGASVSVFCLLSQIRNQIYNMLIEQIWPCSSVFSKPSPTTYHINSVLIDTTVNCQETNLKTALLWLLSFRW